jgi:hypothetical protein
MTLHTGYKDTPVRDEDTLATDGDTLTNDEDTLNRDEDNREIRNCCGLNIRDCMCAVACCFSTRNYSRIELRTM